MELIIPQSIPKMDNLVAVIFGLTSCSLNIAEADVKKKAEANRDQRQPV